MKYLSNTASLEFFPGQCVGNCSFGALNVDKGVGCAAAVINSIISGGVPSCDCSGKKKTGDCC